MIDDSTHILGKVRKIEDEINRLRKENAELTK